MGFQTAHLFENVRLSVGPFYPGAVFFCFCGYWQRLSAVLVMIQRFAE